MKILYFSEGYTTHDRRFLSGLAAAGHEVSFLRYYPEVLSLDRRPLPPGVASVDAPATWQGLGVRKIFPAEAARDLVRILDHVAPDAAMAGPLPTCGALMALCGFHPWIAVSWASDLLLEAVADLDVRERCRGALGAADWFQCDCDAVLDAARGICPFPGERVVQFPWGIDVNKFSARGVVQPLRNLPGWQEAFIVLSTRSWEPIYDHPTLLAAFAEAVRQVPELRLALLGDGSTAAIVRQQIRDLGIESQVSVPGRIGYDLLPSYFRAADLYVTATISDGSSISLLEAMATHLPVLVTDNPGNREWVRPDSHGWLARAGDVHGFASAMMAAATSDRTELARFGDTNRRLVEVRADWGQNFPRLLAAFEMMEAIDAD